MVPHSFSCVAVLLGLCFLFPGSHVSDLHFTHEKHTQSRHPPCQKIAIAIINSSFTMLQEAARHSRHSNILFSPMKIAMSLTMLSLGTKGEAHKQILEGLGLNFTDMPEEEVHKCFHEMHPVLHQRFHKFQIFSSGNIFINKSLTLTDEFQSQMQKIYHSQAVFINFKDTIEAQKQSNSRIEQESQKRMMGMVPYLGEDTTLVLVNYMIFNGKWYDEYNSQRVVKEKFFMDRKMALNIPTINQWGIYSCVRVSELSSMVLTYLDRNEVQIFFILPDKGKINTVEQTLAYQHINWVERHYNLRAIKLHMPELYMSKVYDLESLLSSIGITDIFTDKAIFSGVTGVAPMKLSKAIHKTVFTMDDKGTEASGKPFPLRDPWASYPTIRFNRPFLIFITDQKYSIPFLIARVRNPRQ